MGGKLCEGKLAPLYLRPSTYDGYKKTIANYINPYIGGVALNQLTPAMVDKMFQQIIDKGLKPSTAAGGKARFERRPGTRPQVSVY
ncbi:N-terminal phage integrase SAM-like domain-containing protein [Eisenbergiella massiliensis]|uniref:N-terminal phage integrase SAM-like domain-containing protein n=1 Tax=Eisenbergiella massiliensis TaxID=1720294 RepID=UPI001FA90E10